MTTQIPRAAVPGAALAAAGVAVADQAAAAGKLVRAAASTATAARAVAAGQLARTAASAIGTVAAAQRAATGKLARAAATTAAAARASAGGIAPRSPAPALMPPRLAAALQRALVQGYAGASAATGELAFLKDPKLSLEDKLMRLLGHLNKRYEADIQKKMEEIAGTSSTATTRKKKGAFAQLADVAGQVLGPAVGAALRAPGVGTALAKLGPPVAAAAAAALGAPGLAPVLLKAAPAIVSAASAVATQASGTASGAAMSDKDKELRMMEIQRLQNQQNEMFRLVSSILRGNHETRLAVIGNIR